MTAPMLARSSQRTKRVAAFLSFAAMALFLGNIFIGKYRILTGTGIAAPLDGVPEFLILTLSISLFVVCMLYAEREHDQEKDG